MRRNFEKQKQNGGRVDMPVPIPWRSSSAAPGAAPRPRARTARAARARGVPTRPTLARRTPPAVELLVLLSLEHLGD